jgi:TPR repeat protein
MELTDEIKTDLNFAEKFTNNIAEDYQTAIEFLNDNPDYALLKFRKVIEQLCVFIAIRRDIEFTNNVLFDRINFLNDVNLINRNTKDLFHEVRDLTNFGVHYTQKPNKDDDATFILETKKKCLENARLARKQVIELFKDVFLLIRLGNTIPKITNIDYSDYGFKQIIYEGATSASYLAKLKAGIAYHAIAKQIPTGKHLFLEPSQLLRYNCLMKLAAINYESSMELSFGESRYNSDPSKIHLYCDVEALFRYSTTAESGALGKEKEIEGIKLLKMAADRGYNEAIADYGAYLYDEKRYKEAKEYLNNAIKVDSPIAYRVLFHYYSEVEVDETLAMEHLNRAIELGCADSIGDLGILHHKGFIVEKDNVEAERLLLDAIDKGSYSAKRYHFVEFNDLVGQLQNKGQDMLAQFDLALEKAQKELEQSKSKPITVVKIGRNQLCSCGSNKKYKKCCG